MIKLLKVEVIHHKNSKDQRHAIYSVDFQPNYHRIATAGGDSTVRIWCSENCLASVELAQDSLLSTLEYHTKSVNIVRWSVDGYYLASGSDDNLILIYKHTPDALSNQPFGSKSKKSRECWSRCYTLNGHSMDVLDLHWSPKPNYLLASASIDNHTIIWQLENSTSTTGINASVPNKSSTSMLSPSRILSGHTGYVKGLSFDPTGKFLTTVSSDNNIIVWDCNTWEKIHTNNLLLKNVPDNTVFRRVSWSPDGTSFCLTSGIKSKKSVGMVIRRSTWETVVDLVGHESQTTACRFNPSIFLHQKEAINNKESAHTNSSDSSDSNNKSGSRVTCLIALGDNTGCLTIWTTSRPTPILILRNAFTAAIADLSWNSNGNLLAISSLDGNVIFIDFQQQLGQPLSTERLSKHFQSLYGQSKSDLLAPQSRLIADPLTLRYLTAKPPASSMASAATDGTSDPPAAVSVGLKLSTTGSSSSGNMINTDFNSQYVGLFPIITPSVSNINVISSCSSITSSARDASDNRDVSCNTSEYSSYLSLPTSNAVSTTSTTFIEAIANSSNFPPQLFDVPISTSDVPNISGSSSYALPVTTATTTTAVPALSTAATTLPSTTTTASSQAASTTTSSASGRNLGTSNVSSTLSGKKRIRPILLGTANTVTETLPVDTNKNIPETTVNSIRNNDKELIADDQINYSGSSSSSSSSSGSSNQQSDLASLPATVTGNAAVSETRRKRVVSLPTPAPQTAKTSKKHTSNNISNNTSSSISNPTTSFSVTVNAIEKICSLPTVTQLSSEITLAVRRPPSLAALSTSSPMTPRAGLQQMFSSAASSTSSSPPSLYLKTSRLLRPVPLLQSKFSGSNLIQVTLFSSIHCQQRLWTSILTGDVTCVCGAAAGGGGGVGGSANAQSTGVVGVGCLDGTVHLLNLQTGIRLRPPIVIGGAVVFMDAIQISSSNSSNSSDNNDHSSSNNRNVATISNIIRLLVVTIDGQILIWDITMSTTTQVQLLLKDTLWPLLYSGVTRTASTAANTSNTSNSMRMEVECCSLTDAGDALLVTKLPSGATTTSMANANDSTLGIWQAYLFSYEMQCWIRLSDMQSVLSQYFSTTAFPQSIQFSNNTNSEGLASPTILATTTTTAPQPATTSLSLSEIHMSTITNNNYTLTHGILDLIELFLADVDKMNEWSKLCTMAHVEEKLSIVLDLRNASELSEWLTKWTLICLQNGQSTKIRNLVNSFLLIIKDQKNENNSQNKCSVQSNHKNTCNIVDINNNSSMNKDDGPNGLPASQFYYNKCKPTKPPINYELLIRNIIIPAIGRSSHLDQTLLVELHELLEHVCDYTTR